MPSSKKLLQAAAGSAGGEALNVEDVFSTQIYVGNATTRNITNNIDLSNEGGLVWTKSRTSNDGHNWYDTERGVTKVLYSNDNAAEGTDTNEVTAFNEDGYTLNQDGGQTNGNGTGYASWTFRKAPKFFDMVTFTGTGSQQNISHNLDGDVGFLIVKSTSAGGTSWACWHRTFSSNQFTQLNAGNPVGTNSVFFPVAPTSTQFTVGTDGDVNQSGATYIAYLFAHNDGDGGFGPDGDLDIIKCGTYTTDSSGTATVNLGFEPQWIMRKRTDSSQDWAMFDIARGWTSNDDEALTPNNVGSESSAGNQYNITSNGFEVKEHAGTATYIWVAIRRGTKIPTDADDIFEAKTTENGTLTAALDYPDMILSFFSDTPARWETTNRLLGFLKGYSSNTSGATANNKFLTPNSTATEDSPSRIGGLGIARSGSLQGSYIPVEPGVIANGDHTTAFWFKRAPSVFDVVLYDGNGTIGRTVPHNLTTAPGMIWIKNRDDTNDWMVYAGLDGSTPKKARLNNANVWADAGDFNNTEPTDSVFTLAGDHTVNNSGETYVAYLFGTLAGISKVGVQAHTTGTRTYVDCGFSAGARWVMFKYVTSSTGLGGDPSNWHVFDTARGIVGGIDSRIALNTTADPITTGNDYIDPDNAGFSLPGGHPTGDYIFIAIA